jgi:hypothetical protein
LRVSTRHVTKRARRYRLHLRPDDFGFVRDFRGDVPVDQLPELPLRVDFERIAGRNTAAAHVVKWLEGNQLHKKT